MSAHTPGPWRMGGEVVSVEIKNAQLREILQNVNQIAAQRDELYDFVKSLLNPEENGRAVSAHIRNEARKALGMTNREPV